jgi:hypothetical protein
VNGAAFAGFRCASGWVNVASVASADRVTELDELTSAVVETARLSARTDWGQEPRLFALVTRATLPDLGPAVPAAVRDAPPTALIPLEQDPLPTGEPAAVLATLHWPAGVAGCVLVTELADLPPTPTDKAADATVAAAQWSDSDPGRRTGRLCVGVLRDGSYACCLQLRGEQEDDLVISNALADDVVAALLGTF